jgi:hypothetical protein
MFPAAAKVWIFAAVLRLLKKGWGAPSPERRINEIRFDG